MKNANTTIEFFFQSRHGIFKIETGKRRLWTDGEVQLFKLKTLGFIEKLLMLNGGKVPMH